MAELRLRGLDEATTEKEVRARLAQAGGCEPDVFRVGPIRHAPRALGTVWVRCPIEPAQKIAAGRLQIGWIHVNVEMLRDRPMQCYKCMGRGHVLEQCKSEVDRRKACYNCGKEGHLARECRCHPKCMLCEEAGVPSGRRMGSSQCTPPKKRRNVGGKSAGGTKNPTAGGKSKGNQPTPKAPPVMQPQLQGRRSQRKAASMAPASAQKRK